MTETPRAKRVESYRSRSLEADRLVASGKTQDALALLEKAREDAEAAGDEEYRLFFDAELLSYTAPDYGRQVAIMEDGLRWTRQRGLPADHFMLRTIGVYQSLAGDQDAAMAWTEKALAVNPKDCRAMFQMGASLFKKGDEDAAIGWFEKALAANPKDSDAMRQMGVSLSRKGDEDAAMAWYEKALTANPNDPDAMRQMGVSLSKKGDHGTAMAWYEKALAANPRDGGAYREMAVNALHRGDRRAAFERIRDAARLSPKEFEADFRLVCWGAGRDADQEWSRLFPAAPTSPRREDEGLQDLRGFILSIRAAYEGQTGRFLQQKEEWENRRKGFLSSVSLLDPKRSVLLVLRRWNSYTPAIPSSGEERSRGGGYFVWHQGRGTVIDPGYNFLENFAGAGCRICDIHNVILTHAHNDHTAEFETLRMLLHEFNDNHDLKERKATKRVRFFVNNGAMLKFSGMLDLAGNDYTDRVYTMNPDWECGLGPGLSLRVLPANHDEMVARDQSVGLLLTADLGGAKRTLLFTGDTGLFPLQKDSAKLVPDTTGREVWDLYPKDDGRPVSPDLMVVHIGSIRETELRLEADRTPQMACYPNHLGIIGTARLVTQCRPRLAVVSEFGEEMRDFRVDLIRGLQENVIDKVSAERPGGRRPRVVAGDLPFIYDIGAHTVFACDTDAWEDADAIDFEYVEGTGGREGAVYYCKERDVFREDVGFCVDRFWPRVDKRKGLYFANR